MNCFGKWLNETYFGNLCLSFVYFFASTYIPFCLFAFLFRECKEVNFIYLFILIPSTMYVLILFVLWNIYGVAFFISEFIKSLKEIKHE